MEKIQITTKVQKMSGIFSTIKRKYEALLQETKINRVQFQFEKYFSEKIHLDNEAVVRNIDQLLTIDTIDPYIFDVRGLIDSQRTFNLKIESKLVQGIPLRNINMNHILDIKKI